jgi:hypothetical protein
LLGKMLHAVLSAAYTGALFHLFRMEGAVAGYLTQQVGALANLRFADSLRASLPLTLGLLCLFIAGAMVTSKRPKPV